MTIPYPIAPDTVEAEAIRTLMFAVERLAGVEGVLEAALAIKTEAHDRMRAERDALVEACLDHFEPGDTHTFAEYWINRLEGDLGERYASRDEAIRAIRKSAGLEAEDG